MNNRTILKIGSCTLLCLTGFLFSTSICLISNNFGSQLNCSGGEGGDPTPLPPNPPPPPPPGVSFGLNLV